MKSFPITVMIKPTSISCNMRCKYCFYADEARNRKVPNYGLMSADTQENVIKRIFDTGTSACTIAFQGGEPTLAGLEFYLRQLELERKYNIHGISVKHAIQTNGLLIDDRWADFFAKNDFLVGVSLDGIKEIHDMYRVDLQGKGTYSRVIRAIQILKRNNVNFNILSVLTEQGAKKIRATYGFYGRNELVWQQYIPCLNPLETNQGEMPYSLSNESFLYYLKAVFDCWYNDTMNAKFRYHRYFFNLVDIILGNQPEACDMNGICSIQYAIEADGSVYPCDFYMIDEWMLGNLNTDDFQHIDDKRRELRFIELSAEALNECKGCKWIGLCRGGCRRYREGQFGNPSSSNRFCEAYKDFFEYAYPKLEQIAKLVNNGELFKTQ